MAAGCWRAVPGSASSPGGTQLSALQTQGLAIRDSQGDFSSADVQAATSAEALPPAGVVLLTVKLYDLDDAARIAASCRIGNGLVVGLQNGISAFQHLRRTLPAEQVMVGPVYNAARLVGPGVVEYSGQRHRVVIGSPIGAMHAAATELVTIWRQAGVEAELSNDIQQVLWMKFLGFATNAALTCLSRQPAGIVYRDRDLLQLARSAITEIMTIAKAEGIALSADAADRTIALLQSFPPDMIASMRQDLDAGRRLELDGITGAIVRLGHKHALPTPFHATAYACLKPYRDGASHNPLCEQST